VLTVKEAYDRTVTDRSPVEDDDIAAMISSLEEIDLSEGLDADASLWYMALRELQMWRKRAEVTP